MNRVPASLAVVMLAASGHPVSPITLRSWVYRGHISRQEGGYDLREILDYITRRERSTTVDDLITFLRARLDEAEVEANSHYNLRSDGPRNIDSRPRGDVLLVSIEGGPEKEMSHKQYIDAFMVPKPDERALAEVAAKRQIIELVIGAYAGYAVLPLLALPYAGHPDYREDWKP